MDSIAANEPKETKMARTERISQGRKPQGQERIDLTRRLAAQKAHMTRWALAILNGKHDLITQAIFLNCCNNVDRTTDKLNGIRRFATYS